MANNKGKITESVIKIVVAPALGTATVDEIIDLVKVYPNPVTDNINIESTTTEIEKLELYDLQGRLILTKKVNKNKFQLNLSQLQTATYQLYLYTDKGKQSVKVIKK